LIASLKIFSSSSESSKERTHCLWENSSLIDLRQSVQSTRISQSIFFVREFKRSTSASFRLSCSSELSSLFFYSNFNLFSRFFFSYLVFSSFLMNNRSFNTKKIKILAKIHRILTSEHKNQSFMSEDFVDSFYQETKSSFIRFTFFKLITEVSDLSRSSRNTKNRSSTRRIVKNIESHDSMSENFKKKYKTKMNLLKEFVKSDNRSKNRAT
jgi:hypothetical protein